jgi:hypothetical protein
VPPRLKLLRAIAVVTELSVLRVFSGLSIEVGG